MKKFTNLNESKLINTEESVEEVIEGLLESLTIEIEGSDKVWENDFKIKADKKFYDGLKKTMDKIYHKEKLAMMNKIKESLYTKDISWIDDEVESIYENLKK